MKVNGNNAYIAPRKDCQAQFGQASVFRQNGRIVVDAGAGDDQINVRKSIDGRYHVGVNGQDFSFTRSEFAALTLRGGSGNDRLRIDPSVDVPMRIEGGSGNDQISGSLKQSQVYGGSGQDNIALQGRDNFVHGGGGNDVLRANGDRNYLYGGAGSDWLNTYGFNNRTNGGTGWDETQMGNPNYRVAGHVLFSKIRG